MAPWDGFRWQWTDHRNLIDNGYANVGLEQGRRRPQISLWNTSPKMKLTSESYSDMCAASLHVYKGVGGIWSNDRIVKSADKTTVVWVPIRYRSQFRCLSALTFRYYLSLTRNAIGWTSLLSAKCIGGPGICKITQTNIPPSDLLEFSFEWLADKWKTRMRQKNHFPGTSHIFMGPDGEQYCWKWSESFSLRNDLQVGKYIVPRRSHNSGMTPCFT